MQIPANMVNQATTFCSFQPCGRVAVGDINIEQGGSVASHPICERHLEYLESKFNDLADMPPDIESKEIVFASEIPRDTVAAVARDGQPFDIVE